MADIVALRRRADRMAEGAVLTSALAGLVQPATGPPPGSSGDRVLPVLPELKGLLPAGGLRRGSTVLVAPGLTSLLLAVLAGASTAGFWCAVVGLPAVGIAAAADLGIDLNRLALVPDPGAEWPTVVAALLDGVDLVATAPGGPVAASIASRLAARARQRGSVLVPFGRWTGADVVLQAPGPGAWHGLGRGRGRLTRRELVIQSRGRGAASRSREVTVWLPSPTGALTGAVAGHFVAPVPLEAVS